ncbi:MAG: hypothetical protein AB7P21_01650 [Lautropia sp.]
MTGPARGSPSTFARAARRFARAPANLAAASVLLVAAPVAARAETTIIGSGAAEIYVGAGYSNPTVDTIHIRVPGARVGDGTPIAGLENNSRTATLVDARIRAPRANSRIGIWTVDSSQPLVCATPATCGSTTIPMNRFRWISQGGEIGDGGFDGSTNQPLYSFPNSRYVYVFKTFFYANDAIVPAGRYTGRVVYTLTMP